MKNGKYTIKVIFNNKKNQMPILAYCKEFDLWAEHETLPEALSALFDGINEFEKDENISFKINKLKEFNFTIPTYEYA